MGARGSSTIECVVVSGLGSAGRKPPTAEEKTAEIERLTGIAKVPGSLNLRPTSFVKLRKRAGVLSSRGLLYVGSIDGVPVAFRSYPADRVGRRRPASLLLVYASCHLRTELGVTEGDVLKLDVPKQALWSASPWLRCLDRLLGWPRRASRSVGRSIGSRSSSDVS